VDRHDQFKRPAVAEPAPVWAKGRWFEQFELGDRFDHHWGRTLNSGDNSLFCTATLNFLPLYLDETHARQLGYPGTPLHPMLVFATTFGLSVEDLSEGGKGGPLLEIEKLRFVRTAFPEVTIHAESTVLATRHSRSRPEFGIVSWETQGFDEAANLLVEFQRTSLVRKMPPGEA
jgi:acyl dehydratase